MRALLALLLLAAAPAFAQRAHTKETVLDYLKGRDDLPAKTRKKWEVEVKKRFDAEALKQQEGAAVSAAKEIVAAAIFMNVSADKGAKAAWEGHRAAASSVPPPVAVHYQILALQ